MENKRNVVIGTYEDCINKAVVAIRQAATFVKMESPISKIYHADMDVTRQLIRELEGEIANKTKGGRWL